MRHVILLFVCLVFSLTQSAFAGVIYTDRTAWEAAITSSTTDAFGSNVSRAASITFASGVQSVTTDATLSGNDNRVQGGEYRNVLDNNAAGLFTTWTFPSAINAFGFDISGVSSGGLAFSGDFDGIGTQQVNVFEEIGGTNGFIGVIGASTFNSIQFFNRSASSEAYSIDNLAFGTGTSDTVAVPEPSTWALLTLAGFGFGGYQLRRRNAKKNSEESL